MRREVDQWSQRCPYWWLPKLAWFWQGRRFVTVHPNLLFPSSSILPTPGRQTHQGYQRITRIYSPCALWYPNFSSLPFLIHFTNAQGARVTSELLPPNSDYSPSTKPLFPSSSNPCTYMPLYTTCGKLFPLGFWCYPGFRSTLRLPTLAVPSIARTSYYLLSSILFKCKSDPCQTSLQNWYAVHYKYSKDTPQTRPEKWKIHSKTCRELVELSVSAPIFIENQTCIYTIEVKWHEPTYPTKWTPLASTISWSDLLMKSIWLYPPILILLLSTIMLLQHICLQQRILPCGPHTIQQAKAS